MGAKRTLVARALRLAVIQNQYDIGNLSTEEAKELLRGCLKPGDESTRIDDSDQLVIRDENA